MPTPGAGLLTARAAPPLINSCPLPLRQVRHRRHQRRPAVHDERGTERHRLVAAVAAAERPRCVAVAGRRAGRLGCARPARGGRAAAGGRGAVRHAPPADRRRSMSSPSHQACPPSLPSPPLSLQPAPCCMATSWAGAASCWPPRASTARAPSSSPCRRACPPCWRAERCTAWALAWPCTPPQPTSQVRPGLLACLCLGDGPGGGACRRPWRQAAAGAHACLPWPPPRRDEPRARAGAAHLAQRGLHCGRHSGGVRRGEGRGGVRVPCRASNGCPGVCSGAPRRLEEAGERCPLFTRRRPARPCAQPSLLPPLSPALSSLHAPAATPPLSCL